MARPRFSVRVQNFIPQTGRIRRPKPDLPVYFETATTAEKCGYFGVTMYDHFYRTETHVKVARNVLGPGLEIMPETMPELWTTLTHMASITERIRVVANVISINFRAPSLVAAMTSTLDNVSRGRLEVGLGAGGDREETASYGLSRPSDPAERAQKLDEFVRILKLMWSEEAPTFHGKFFKIDGARAPLKPVQKPHPPINIGASQPLLLRVAARHADILTPALFCGGDRGYERLKAVLKKFEEECEAVGREYDEVTKAVLFRLMVAENERELEAKLKMWTPGGYTTKEYRTMVYCGMPKDFERTIKRYVDAGVSYFFLDFMDLPSMSGIELFAHEVMNRL